MLNIDNSQFDLFVKNYAQYQKDIVNRLSLHEDTTEFLQDEWQSTLGTGISMVIQDGATFEKAGVNISNVAGDALPVSATNVKPELANKPWKASGISLVIHPRNPNIPTCHANFRVFKVDNIAWFGGGYDLTPYLPFAEDCRYWHAQAKNALSVYGDTLYKQFKKNCDDYFYLPHRKETRGIGGLFFDNFSLPEFENNIQMIDSLVKTWLSTYVSIIEKRKDLPYNERQRKFQLYRRGRYVEFNLLYDRGTLFGIQSGGRTESILMSLPPKVEWHYRFKLNEEEKIVINNYFKPKDWLA